MSDRKTDEPKTHELKTWPAYFQAMIDGNKKFDIRKDDRGYMLGDELRLQEYDQHLGLYTGRGLSAIVDFKVDGGQFGIEPGYCVLSVRILSFTDPEIRS